jgi:hypothetical protein
MFLKTKDFEKRTDPESPWAVTLRSSVASGHICDLRRQMAVFLRRCLSHGSDRKRIVYLTLTGDPHLPAV